MRMLDTMAKMAGLANLWKLLVSVGIFSVFIAWLLISRAIEEEWQRLIAEMHSRAESIIWSIEGAARFFNNRHHGNSAMLEEIGRQPGIAWIALVAESGHVLADSNAQIVGKLLYTRLEIAGLQINSTLKGRFEPDDPDVYETWKLFRPARLKGRGPHENWKTNILAPKYIFVALDAANFHTRIEEYSQKLLWIASLSVCTVLSAIALAFYIYNYRTSARNLVDAQIFAAQLLKSYPAALLATDRSGKVRFCNDLAARMFGLQVVPENVAEIPYLDWQGILEELDNNITVHGQEKNLLLKDGRQIPASLSAYKIRSVDTKTPGYLFVLNDLEEIKRLQKKLRQSEQLSATGRLAAGVAHEIRNPLSSICGYAHYLEKKLVSDPMSHATARLLVEEAQRLDGVLAGLLSVARPGELNLKRQSLTAILQRTLALVKPDAEAKNIALELRLPGDDKCTSEPLVDADRLIQAILNLVINALQATPANGKVSMTLEFVESATGGSWHINIADTGKGMDNNVLQQIFTPYFTTRANGTGLGLAIARQICEMHGGSIHAASVPGRGSTFTVILPA